MAHHRLAGQPAQLFLALDQWQLAQVVAVVLQRVERQQHRLMAAAAQFEAPSSPIIVASRRSGRIPL
jgi:hypothetical protein